MKTIIFFTTLILGIECFGQSKEVIYGTIRIDGYQKITKGAFWATRPEAKLIYEGKTPPEGYNVFILESDYFVRFKNGENNQFDRNYIVFPKGEKVYTDRSGQFYSAICGNKIEYIRPVNLVEFKNNNVVKQQDDWTFVVPKKINEGKEINFDFYKPVTSSGKKDNRWIKWVVGGVGGAVLSGIAGKILIDRNNDIPIVIESRTMPPSIPDKKTPIIPPTVPSDPRGMPPGIGFSFHW